MAEHCKKPIRGGMGFLQCSILMILYDKLIKFHLSYIIFISENLKISESIHAPKSDFYRRNNRLKDNAVVTDIAGDYRMIKIKNHTLLFNSLNLVSS